MYKRKAFPCVISGYFCCFNSGISSSQFWVQLCTLIYFCGLVFWFWNWKRHFLNFNFFNLILNSISVLFRSVCWSCDASTVLHAKLWQETPDASRFTNTETRKKFGDIYMKWYGWTPGNVSLVNIRTEVTGIEMNFVATRSQDERFTVLRTHWLVTIFFNFYYIIARTAQNLRLSYWSFTTTPRGRLSLSPFYM